LTILPFYITPFVFIIHLSDKSFFLAAKVQSFITSRLPAYTLAFWTYKQNLSTYERI